MRVGSLGQVDVGKASALRFIQQGLGLEQLETAQIYAQVGSRPLKEVHTRAHQARLTLDPEWVAEPDEEEDELASEERAE